MKVNDFLENKRRLWCILFPGKTFAAILEKTTSLCEGELERTDYTLAKFRIGW